MKEPTFDEILEGYEKKLSDAYSISDLEKRRDYLGEVLSEFQNLPELSCFARGDYRGVSESMGKVATIENRLYSACLDADLESKVGLTDHQKQIARLKLISEVMYDSKYYSSVVEIKTREFARKAGRLTPKELNKPFTI